MQGSGSKGSGGSKKSVRRSRLPGEPAQTRHISGRWKLVYADFVTVLMAFFIVMWILRIDYKSKTEVVKLSNELELDRTCTNRVAEIVREKLRNDPTVDMDKPPIEVINDLMVDGVRFTLVDSQEPMFERGQATLSAFAEPHLKTIAEAISLCSSEHKLSIEGYTDAEPFRGSAGRTNWELSADRANAARRKLVELSVDDRRISEVTGYGDSRPAYPDDPNSPLNRRVSITLLAPFAKESTEIPVETNEKNGADPRASEG